MNFEVPLPATLLFDILPCEAFQLILKHSFKDSSALLSLIQSTPSTRAAVIAFIFDHQHEAWKRHSWMKDIIPLTYNHLIHVQVDDSFECYKPLPALHSISAILTPHVLKQLRRLFSSTSNGAGLPSSGAMLERSMLKKMTVRWPLKWSYYRREGQSLAPETSRDSLLHDFVNLVKNLPHLEELHLDCRYINTSLVLNHLALSRPLKRLVLGNSESFPSSSLSAEAIAFLAGLEGFSCTPIFHCREIVSSFPFIFTRIGSLVTRSNEIPNLQRFKRLESLDLNVQIEDMVGFGTALKQLYNLRSLRLEYQFNCKPKGEAAAENLKKEVLEAVRSLHNLEELDLKTRCLSTKDMMEIVQTRPKLKHLTMPLFSDGSDLFDIIESLLFAIWRHCPGLTSLQFSGFKQSKVDILKGNDSLERVDSLREQCKRCLILVQMLYRRDPLANFSRPQAMATEAMQKLTRITDPGTINTVTIDVLGAHLFH